MRKLAEMGKSIIIITHKLHEVMAVADRVMVMRQGRFIQEMPKSETSIEEMSFLMVGRHIVERKVPPQEPGERVLDVRDLVLSGYEGKNLLDHFNMHVDAGEIVGIAGVSGNGQSELIQCLTGLLPADLRADPFEGAGCCRPQCGRDPQSGLRLHPGGPAISGAAPRRPP